MHEMVPISCNPLLPGGGIFLLEQRALQIGLLASSPTVEQVEKLLGDLLSPDESMIRGPDGMEPLAWLRAAGPDVLILDASHGGMELAGALQAEGRPLPVILLADDCEQVLDGYRLSVKRCLMKPPGRERLEEALEFCRSAYGRQSFQVSLRNGNTTVIRFSEILWFRGRGHKILLYMEGRTGPLEFLGAIPRLEHILPGSFVRCHNSTTVNTDKVRALERSAAILTDGSRVPVSRRKRELVESQYRVRRRLRTNWEGEIL